MQAECNNGKVQRVKVHNLPSFAAQTDTHIEVTGIGTLRVDTAFGGDSFVMVDARDLGFELLPSEARDIAEISIPITRAANEQLGFRHPTNPDWKHISFCQLVGDLQPQADSQFSMRNAVVIEPGKLDRSPCGTGVSARMALLHHKGIMQQGDRLRMFSPIDSVFDGCIEKCVKIGDIQGIIPSIAGRGFITGTHQHTLDPCDPWPEGYRLSDTWPRL
ncbi:MAG: proline racemase [Parasphingorhabdus sp.]